MSDYVGITEDVRYRATVKSIGGDAWTIKDLSVANLERLKTKIMSGEAFQQGNMAFAPGAITSIQYWPEGE